MNASRFLFNRIAPFTLKHTTLDGVKKFEIWDTSGQERFVCFSSVYSTANHIVFSYKQRALTPMFTRDSHVFILVFDVTDEHYLEGLEPFVNIVHDITGKNHLTTFFCGNKIYLVDSSFNESEVFESLEKRFSDRIPSIRVIFTSALTGEGIDKIIPTILDYLPSSYNSNDNTN